MPWNPNKDLLQFQVDPEWAERLQKLAETDERSRAQEAAWLLKAAIRKREEELGLPPEVEGEKDAGAGALVPARAVEAARGGGSKEFRQAAVFTWVVAELHEGSRSVSRFRVGKMIYLIEQAQELGLFRSFAKAAAGPYDPKLRYGGPEKIAVSDEKWLIASDSTHFEPGPNVSEGLAVAEEELDVEVAKDVLARFRRYSDGALERWTTVDMAARELSKAGKEVTVESVLAYIESIDEWAAKLKRSEFERDKLESTLTGLRKSGLLGE